MENIKEINIKNRTYYFFDDMINIKIFDPNLLKIDKRLYKNIDIYYITMKYSNYVKVNSVNPFYLIIGEVDGYFEESISMNRNKEVFTKYIEIWNEIKYSIEKINNKSGEYGKHFMKIKFNLDDCLPFCRWMFVWVIKILQYDWLMFQKKLTSIRQVHQKSVIFVIIGILKMSVINFNHMFVMVGMVYQWWLMS